MRRTKAEILMELGEARRIIALALRCRGLNIRPNDPWEYLATCANELLIARRKKP